MPGVSARHARPGEILRSPSGPLLSMRTKEEHRVNEGPWVGDAHVATRIVNEVDTVVSMTVFGGADETARLTGRTPPRRQRSLRRQAFVVILPVRTVGVTGDF